ILQTLTRVNREQNQEGDCSLNGERAIKMTPHPSSTRRCEGYRSPNGLAPKTSRFSFTDPVRTVRQKTMNPGSVPGFHLTSAVPSRDPRRPTSARWSAFWRRWSKTLALMLLAAAAAAGTARPVRAATGPQADLVVTMIAVPLNVPVGGRIEYRIAVTNQG